MDIEKIQEDRHFKSFIKSRNLKKSSINLYRHLLKKYCEYIGETYKNREITLTELIEEAEEEEENRIRMKKRKIKEYILDYMDFVGEQELSYNTRNKIQMTIRTFYREFEIELPRPVRLVDEEKELITTESMIHKEHIQKALDRSGLKYKAIIKTIMSSGMGASEIINLKYTDFLTGLNIALKKEYMVDDLRDIISDREELDKIPCWKIRRFKTKKPYFTFSSPESVESILEYIEAEELRERYYDKDSFLFRTPRMGQMEAISFTKTFRALNDRCGFGFLGRQRFFKSHNLRKYFATTLYTDGVREKTIDWLLGHKIIVVNGRYIKSDIEAVKVEYLKGLPDLSMENVEIKTIYSKEYAGMQEQIDELRKQVEFNEKQREAEMKAELSRENQSR